MAYSNIPLTRNGLNMYDMASMMQKACRRNLTEDAGFAACELFGNFHTMMWNRMIVISCEDCCGAFTKELIRLRDEDEKLNAGKKGYFRDTSYVSRGIHLLSNSIKSRDACYFSCNFIIATDYNKVNKYSPSDAEVKEWMQFVDSIPDSVLSYPYMTEGVALAVPEMPVQMDLFGSAEEVPYEYKISTIIRDSIRNNDMEAIGRAVSILRKSSRKLLWKTMFAIALDNGGYLAKEMIGLFLADLKINGKRPIEKKDEIFISKAVMLLCYEQQQMFEHLISQPIVEPTEFVNWDGVDVLSIMDCNLKDGIVPEWVYDCHTLKGKKAGKTDWQMNIVEQAALNPLKRAFFDDGTWQSLYEWLWDMHQKDPNHWLARGEWEEHMAYREGRWNNPITQTNSK